MARFYTRLMRSRTAARPLRAWDVCYPCSAMAAVCDICGKKPFFGKRVSHSTAARTAGGPERAARASVVNGSPKRVNACTSCIKAGKVQRAARTAGSSVRLDRPELIHGPDPAPERERVPDRLGHERLARAHGLQQLGARARCARSPPRACTRPVRVRRVHAGSRDPLHPLPVEEQVLGALRALEVAALHEHGSRPEPQERLRRPLHVRRRAHREPHEGCRLGEVRGGERRER